jgi:hypothetical protein
VDAERQPGVPFEEFLPSILEVMEAGGDAGVCARAVAGFGIPWRKLTPVAGWAQTRMLEEAPADFALELLRWSPDDIRGLRERWVCGGHESFVRAIRTIGTYRGTGLWDRRVPLKDMRDV